MKELARVNLYTQSLNIQILLRKGEAMITKIIDLYEALKPMTEEEIYLASCPVIEKDGSFFILDEKRELLIPLRKEK